MTSNMLNIYIGEYIKNEFLSLNAGFQASRDAKLRKGVNPSPPPLVPALCLFSEVGYGPLPPQRILKKGLVTYTYSSINLEKEICTYIL